MSDADTNTGFGFDFAPEWARKSADEYVSRYQSKSYDERTGREERAPRFDRERPRRRFEEDGEHRRPPREGRTSDRPRGPRPPRTGEDRPRYTNDRPRRQDGDRPFVRREPVKPLDAEIRILPNQKNLGAIIKTLQATHVAFPVKKFVNLFLENPQACLVRFEAKPETETRFYSCKVCGLVALSEAEVLAHILTDHLGDFFDITEEPCDPPSGNYPCVAKCTLSGEWVGAPNHHSYRHRVAELAARAGMSEKDFLRTVEMCRDTESVDAWKQSVTTQTVYRRKVEAPAEPPAEGEEAAEQPAAPTYNRDQAEAIFRRDIVPTLVTSARHVCLPVSVAQSSPSVPLRLLLKYTLRDEQRYPRSLFFALRGAFRHRKFALFRGNDPRGPEFVANSSLNPFTTEHAVRELKVAIEYLTAHPLCTRAEFFAALKSELADMDFDVVLRQVVFLFQKGHIVEYYNGVLALPEAHPKFRKLPEEMKHDAPAASEETASEAPAPASEEAPVEDIPAVEEAPPEEPTPGADEAPAEEAVPTEEAAPVVEETPAEATPIEE